MVERIYKEKEIVYTKSGSNPWYSLLNQIADAIVELCGAEITGKATGNVTLTLPGYPGVLYMTAPSGTNDYSTYFYMYLRGKDGTTALVSSKGVPQYYSKGSVTVGYVSIGGFLNALFIGCTSEPNNAFGYWMGVKWHWFVNTTTGKKMYALWGSGTGDMPKKSGVNGISDVSGNISSTIYSEDLLTGYANTFNSAGQNYISYPSDTKSNTLSPLYNFTGVPVAGLCKWGGQYMLFQLYTNSYGYYASYLVETTPDTNYRVNGKTYLACGHTLIIPEPWPFKEE